MSLVSRRSSSESVCGEPQRPHHAESDRRDDPLEVNNLIDKPYIKHVREELARFLAQWQAPTPDDGKRDVIKSFKKR